MSAKTHPIQREPLPTKPSLIPVPLGPKSPRVKWIQWMPAAGLAALIATGALLWRAHLQNAITYEMVPVERGAIQSKVTATGNLNAVVMLPIRLSGEMESGRAVRISFAGPGEMPAIMLYRPQRPAPQPRLLVRTLCQRLCAITQDGDPAHGFPFRLLTAFTCSVNLQFFVYANDRPQSALT